MHPHHNPVSCRTAQDLLIPEDHLVLQDAPVVAELHLPFAAPHQHPALSVRRTQQLNANFGFHKPAMDATKWKKYQKKTPPSRLLVGHRSAAAPWKGVGKHRNNFH